jgi:2-dehydropantoate 2-reductase
MKIGVVGCGALGSYYGAKILQSGHEVHFLLRSDYEAVRRNGVFIRSPQGDFHVQPQAANDPKAIGVCDMVIIGLKTTANARFPELLPALVGPQTLILTLQNGLGNETQLARLFGPERILGGLCFVCLNRTEPGVIQHIDHGLVVLGEYQRRPESRTEGIALLFKNAGVPCEVTQNLERAHWEKLTWNIPFNGLGVASAAGLEALIQGRLEPDFCLGPCLTTDKLLADPNWEELVRQVIHEVILTAQRLGYDLPQSLAELQISRTRSMGPYKASTLIDYERGQALELESLFLEPLRQARSAGVETPRLTALCEVLKQLDQSRAHYHFRKDQKLF